MMTGRAEQWRQLALAAMLGAGCWTLDGCWVLSAGYWGGGEPGLLPSLFSADVSDEDAKYGTLNATSSSLTNVTQRAASGLMIN